MHKQIVVQMIKKYFCKECDLQNIMKGVDTFFCHYIHIYIYLLWKRPVQEFKK